MRDEIRAISQSYMAACRRAARGLEEPDEEGSMLIRVTSSHCLGAGRDVDVGDLLRAPGDVTLRQAREKIARGVAVEVKEPLSLPAAAEMPVETGDPSPRIAEPVARRRRRGKR